MFSTAFADLTGVSTASSVNRKIVEQAMVSCLSIAVRLFVAGRKSPKEAADVFFDGDAAKSRVLSYSSERNAQTISRFFSLYQYTDAFMEDSGILAV